jgi:hypothetical protein
MPLTPDVADELPLRICNFSGADLSDGSTGAARIAS